MVCLFGLLSAFQDYFARFVTYYRGMSTPHAYAIVYTADLIRSLNTSLAPPRRPIRKTLFRFGLWRPAHLRSLPSPPPTAPRQLPASPSSAIRLATLNVCSLKNGVTTTRRTTFRLRHFVERQFVERHFVYKVI